MKFKRLFFKFIITTLILGISLPSTFVNAENSIGNPPIKDEFNEADYFSTIEEVDNILEKYISVNENGIKVSDENTIVERLNSIDLIPLQKALEQNGVDMNGNLDGSKLLDMYTDFSQEVNQEVQNGKTAVVSKDATEVNPFNSSDNDYSINSNVNRDTTHWWGRKRLKSKANANKWAADITTAANINVAAGIGLAIFGGVAGIPNGLTAVYGHQFASRVNYHNNRTNRGIQANVHWTLTFSVNPQ